MERLKLNKEEGIFGGVCSGLGDYFKIDPVVFRLLFVCSIGFAGSLFWLYLILLLIIPE